MELPNNSVLLTLKRHTFTDLSTIGTLYVPDTGRICDTLEDKDRGLIQGEPETYKAKVQNETCIPYGTYEILYQFSPHFQRDMPHLQNVPAYEGILIHVGNTRENTDGCLLVGMKADVDFIESSRVAFDIVDKYLQAVLASGKRVFIQIVKE